MGGLRMFGRRWGISSDDFVFPAITEAVLRCIWWLTILGVYLANYRSESKCDLGHLHAYIIVCLVTNFINIVFSITIAIVSGRGTISYFAPRRHLTLILYWRIPLLCFDFIWNVVGTSWAFAHFNCPTETQLIYAAQATCVLGWILYVIIMIGLLFVFDPTGHLHSDRVALDHHSRRVWKWRLQLVCLCSGKDDNATTAFEDVADIFATFFTDFDLVLTDIWAALMLLVSQDFHALEPKPRAPLGVRPPPPEWMNMQLASRYMSFALGVYGWPYFICDNFNLKSIYQLLHEMRIMQPCRCDNVIVVKDNVCRCNTAALRLQTGITETDLFYISFHNQIYEVPFVAVVDHQTASIVIAIRGSMSLRDAITDLCATDDCLELEANPEAILVESEPLSNNAKQFKVHKGIINSAKFVYAVLENEHILYDLFVLHPDYHLVVTGHSLGAGVASVVALLLKPKYPRVRCFAFSPPGCVVSEQLLPLTEECIFSIIVGYDMVSRLSLQNIHRLKAQILDVLDNCDQPKYYILVRGIYRLICGPSIQQRKDSVTCDVPADDHTNGDVLPTSASHDSYESAQSRPLLRSSVSSYGSYNSRSEQDLNAAVAADPHHISQNDTSIMGPYTTLYCPGRIAHVVPQGDDSFEVHWEHYGTFDSLSLNSRMVSDHMPYNVANVLKQVAGYPIIDKKGPGSREQSP